MSQAATGMNPHEQWLRQLQGMVEGPQRTRIGVPRHVLERIAALLGDDVQIEWVESSVRYARGEEGGRGMSGAIAVFGAEHLVVLTLENVQNRHWAEAPNEDGPVTARLIRRVDLERIEVPSAAPGAYDNGPEAWGRESDGTWRYRTFIKLSYRDGTEIVLGEGGSGDVFMVLPGLRKDLLG